ncbi:MAG: patatin-like phospholipase family protein [Candidatus Paracaedibacteraceae bacterium]|nr:patatin-like phospholipase family protein [Candidatus Paracaedibacteraceae bacterium]
MSCKKLTLIVLTFILNACSEMQFDTTSYKPYNLALPAQENIDIAFVLGGGGAKGIAHVGVMEELIKQGIEPDLIVGCSAGSIVGSLYADSLDIQRVKEILLPQEREHLLNISLNFLPFGITDGSSLNLFLENNLKSRCFEELKIPFISVATNLQYGDMTPIGRGLLIPAVRASAAFPGVFTPIEIGGQYFVDGGVANNVPVETAHQMKAKFIIAIELDAGLPDSAPTNALGILRRCLQISLHHQSRLALSEADYVIRVALPEIGTFDSGLNQLVYERGLDVGRREAAKIKLLIQEKLNLKKSA